MIVAREAELAALARFLDHVPDGPGALVLEGEQGIGKTVLWSHGVELASERGYRVLSCRPTGADSELPFVALGDLLGASTDRSLDALPDPQREALEIALLRRARAALAPDPHAVAVAALGVLRSIAEDAATVIAVDDVQWVDPDTARVLSFVVRRLTGERLGFLLGRPSTQEALPLGLADTLPTERVVPVAVGPLGAHEIAAIIREQTGVSPLRPESVRLTELSGGNPFYALEIARAQARGEEGVTGQRLPIPKSLRGDLVSGRVADVSSAAREVLLVAAAMPRPTVDAIRELLPAETLEAGLQQAIEAGLVEVLGLDVRFAHPLYRSAIYADASRRRRHDVHRRLAATATDPEERARHLALAASGPDPETVEELGRAAAAARERGAPDAAAELLEHAIRLTPRGDLGTLRERLLLVARDRLAAGDAEGAWARAREALRISSTGGEQAEALRSIGQIELTRGSLGEARAILDEALALAGEDARMTSEIHRDLAMIAIRAGEIGAAERHAAAAIDLAGRVGDPALERSATAIAGEVDVLLARPGGIAAEADADGTDDGSISGSPRLVAAKAHLLAGDLEDAQERLLSLLRLAQRHGDEPGRLAVTTALAEAAIRSGAWSRALTLATDARDLALDLGVNGHLETALMAYAAAGRGRAEDARRLADDALRTATGDRPTQLWCLAALGFLELSLARSAEALRHLGRAGGLLAETGIADPSAFPFLSDEAEALVGVGEIDTAIRRIDALEEAGERLGRDLIRGQAARCRGLALAIDGDLPGSMSSLEHAVELHERVGNRMELGRSRLALGATRRRARQQRPAREVLDLALEGFLAAEADAWAERARDELARIGGRRASVGELTEGEARVARLAAAGLSNREIARTLSMSVRTVEGHLGHVYAKLELRSRTELALFFEPPE